MVSNRYMRPGSCRSAAVSRPTLIITALSITVIVAVLVLAVDYERSQTKPTAMQEVTMPDGTTLVLERVTYGKAHTFQFSGARSGLARLLQSSSPTFSAHSVSDSIVVWMSRRDGTGASLDFDWWLRTAAVDGHGCEIQDENPGVYRMFANRGNSSSTGGSRPFQFKDTQFDGRRDKLVVNSQLKPFRNSGTFKLQVFDSNDTMVGEFTVNDPSPSRGQYPVWKPDPLPITVSDGDVRVTLTGLSASQGQVYSDSVRPTVQIAPEFTVEQAGVRSNDWTRHTFVVHDAIGNQSNLWDCRLCPSEPAWKMTLKLFRNAKAPYAPDEQWSVSNVQVPVAATSVALNESTSLQGLTLRLHGIGGAGRVAHPSIIEAGSASHHGAALIDGKQQPFTIESNSQNAPGTITVDCAFPHILARLADMSSEHYAPDLSAVDDQGREVKLFHPISHQGAYIWFMDLDTSSKSLDLTFTVQKARNFEFTVKPPVPEPTELFERADKLARNRQWKEAAEEFDKALEQHPNNHWHWYRSLCLQAYVEDWERYRRQSEQMLNRFEHTGNANIAERTAKACMLRPESPPEMARLTTLLDRALEIEPTNVWFRMARGIGEYRSEQFDAAIDRLGTISKEERSSAFVLVAARAFLAMAQHRAGQPAAAAESFKAATDLMNAIRPNDHTLLDMGWHDWLICTIAHREAERLLAEASAP